MVKIEDCEICKKKEEDKAYTDERQKIRDSKATNVEMQIDFLDKTYHAKHEHVKVSKPDAEHSEKGKETPEKPRWLNDPKEEAEVEPPVEGKQHDKRRD